MRHTADVKAELDTPFRCRRCGASGSAKMLGEGTGSGMSVMGVGGKLADQDAMSEAMEDAARDARNALAVAKCPSCGHRSLVAMARLILPAAVVASFTAVFGAFLAIYVRGFFGYGLAGLFAVATFTLLAGVYRQLRAKPQIRLAPPRAIVRE